MADMADTGTQDRDSTQDMGTQNTGTQDRGTQDRDSTQDMGTQDMTSTQGTGSNRCRGVACEDGRVLSARAVLLSTGGAAAMWARTTNPPGSQGVGLLLAQRVGAALADLELMQFHPTAVIGVPGREGFLITEAIRGEGATLHDAQGERFVDELAPRDEVSRAIQSRLAATRASSVGLDMREIDPALFPNVVGALREAGLDPTRELIPVAPAAHYASGGIATDLLGRTSVPGLYACGEAACTGVHGANRLASNSLLEGLVFARRIAADVLSSVQPGTPLADLGIDVRGGGILAAGIRRQLQREMSCDAGVIRDAAGLSRVSGALQKLSAQRSSDPGTESWEATNLLTVASALVAAAARRSETRGSHWREDFAERDDQNWLGHLDLRLGPDGTISTDYTPAEAAT
jgi:L-aspartate oxidase